MLRGDVQGPSNYYERKQRRLVLLLSSLSFVPRSSFAPVDGDSFPSFF